MNWLVLDCDNLAWRAHYTTGALSHDGYATGVLYGVFREVLMLSRKFFDHEIAFCFDLGQSLRKEIFPGYKRKRLINARPLGDFRTVEKNAARSSCREQLTNLRTKYLPELGYSNVFAAAGYEADDVIASAIRNPGKFTVVSEDRDLYQLLGQGTKIYHPRKKELIDADWLQKNYRVKPHLWPELKAIAGCDSDCIDGVFGVGEITAAKYLHSGRRHVHPQLAKKVEDFMKSPEYQLNLKLTRLPYPGCPKFELNPCGPIESDSWRRVMTNLGIETLDPPLGSTVTNAVMAKRGIR